MDRRADRLDSHNPARLALIPRIGQEIRRAGKAVSAARSAFSAAVGANRLRAIGLSFVDLQAASGRSGSGRVVAVLAYLSRIPPVASPSQKGGTMGVITREEFSEWSEADGFEDSLNVLVPMAGSVCEYNHACDENPIGECGAEVLLRATADVLNRLCRVRFDLEEKGREPLCDELSEWITDTLAGFRLEDVERQLADARGDAEPNKIPDLFEDGWTHFEFQDDELFVNRRIVLRLGWMGEPKVFPVFRDIAGFHRIDAEPLLNAVHDVIGRFLKFRSQRPQGADASHTPTQVRLRESESRIIDVVKSQGRRLTTTQIHGALEKSHGPTSVGMTKQNLAQLVRIGELNNKKDAEPPGYGLPQWS